MNGEISIPVLAINGDSDKRKECFDNLRHDYKQAKSAKTEIDSLITDWNDLYYGIRRNKHGEIQTKETQRKKSGIVMKEIAKHIEWQKPNITEAFLSGSSPIQLDGFRDSAKIVIIEKWINQTFTQEFDRGVLVDQATDVMLREGTVWIQSLWKTKTEKRVRTFENMTMEELMLNAEEPSEIEQNPDGTFNVEYTEMILAENMPDAIILRNEHVMPDPGARTEDEMRFLIIEKMLTIPELRDIPIIDSKKIDILEDMITSEDNEETNLGQERDADARMYGFDDAYEPNDVLRKRIKIIEYWGYYDIEGKKEPEPILAYFSKKHNVDLGIGKNPLPHKEIPVDRSVYSSRPFSLWGNALAFFLEDNQRVKNGIVRGILDNMSLANNNQKFVLRGALDYVNFKRMNNGERHIVINKPNAIEDGSYNTIPNSVFDTLQMFAKESQDLAGGNSAGPALNSGTLNKNSEQQMTMSQKKMSAIVRNMSNLLRKVMTKWIRMAELFLEDEQILALFDGDNPADINVFQNSSKLRVKVNVGTETNRNMQLQQYNMLMQQSKVLEGQLPPGAMSGLVAEMYELFDMHAEASAVRNYKPEPSPEEKAAQQLQLQNAQLENAKLQMEISVMQKDVDARYMNAQSRMMEANANIGYKQAQSAEKYAKTDAHQMDTAMKPVTVENEIKKSNKEAE